MIAVVCPESLVASISAVAVAIAKGKKPQELGLWAVILTQLADSLATIAAARELCEISNNSAQSTDSAQDNPAK